jgi:hypothetical protein
MNAVCPSTKKTSHAFGIGGQIERAERTHFAKTEESYVGLHADNRAVKNGDGLAARPFVGGLVQRKFDSMGEDAGDFHAESRMGFPIIS